MKAKTKLAKAQTEYRNALACAGEEARKVVNSDYVFSEPRSAACGIMSIYRKHFVRAHHNVLQLMKGNQ